MAWLIVELLVAVFFPLNESLKNQKTETKAGWSCAGSAANTKMDRTGHRTAYCTYSHATTSAHHNYICVLKLLTWLYTVSAPGRGADMREPAWSNHSNASYKKYKPNHCVIPWPMSIDCMQTIDMLYFITNKKHLITLAVRRRSSFEGVCAGVRIIL